MTNHLTKPLFLLFCLTLCSCLYGQQFLHLQQYYHLGVKDKMAPNFSPKIFVNENGWVFISYASNDSFSAPGIENDHSYPGSRLMAYDNKGALRWHFTYGAKNTGGGGMLMMGTGADNSIYVYFGVVDSLILGDNIRLYNVSGTHCGRVDSTGKFISVKKNTSNLGVFTASPAADGKLQVISTQNKPFILTPNLDVEMTGTLNSARSAVMHTDGSAVYCFIQGQSPRTLLDTTIDSLHWGLLKVNAQGELDWIHIIDNPTPFEISENKFVRCDKDGNVFWAVQHKSEFEIAGNTIPYYKDGSTATKASILRFDINGNFLGAHYDTDTIAPTPTNRQTVWLENDKDMNVYAYLYVSQITKTFDDIQFKNPKEYNSKNRMLIFDKTANKFNKAWLTDQGNIGYSALPHRPVFRNVIGNSPAFSFTDGPSVPKLWNDDFVIAVYDTTEPDIKPNVQEMTQENPLIRAYPNPSKNTIQLLNQSPDAVECILYSTEMREIKKFEIEGNTAYELKNEISSPGIYFIRCRGSYGDYTMKIIKQ